MDRAEQKLAGYYEELASLCPSHFPLFDWYRSMKRLLAYLLSNLFLVGMSWYLQASGDGPQSDVTITDNSPVIDATRGPVDNTKIYLTFLNRGTELIKRPDVLGNEQLSELLKSCPAVAPLPLPSVDAPSESHRYQSMVESSVMIGTIYDCGRCNFLHANIAGGVVVSSDGLVLTNYHVVMRKEPGVKGLLAMTSDGRVCPIVEIVAASELEDVALIRIQSDEPLLPAKIADHPPMPTERICVLSHPRNEFFVLTEGQVSRFSKPTMPGDHATWMEITAEFAGGSSGSGVFNERAELVGLVSRIFPIFREPEPILNGATQDPNASQRYVEMILRRCVPHSAITDCFQPAP